MLIRAQWVHIKRFFGPLGRPLCQNKMIKPPDRVQISSIWVRFYHIHNDPRFLAKPVLSVKTIYKKTSYLVSAHK